MQSPPEFRCVTCGKPVFNPRLWRCEFCGDILPQELRDFAAQRRPAALERNGCERALDRVLARRADVFDPFDACD